MCNRANIGFFAKKNCVSSFYATSLWKLDSIFSSSNSKRREDFFSSKPSRLLLLVPCFSNEIMCRPIILVKKKIVEAHRFVTPGKIGWTWKMSLEGVVFIRHPDFLPTPFTVTVCSFTQHPFSNIGLTVATYPNVEKSKAGSQNWCTTSERVPSSTNVCPKWWDVVADFCMNCFATSMTTPNHRGL